MGRQAEDLPAYKLTEHIYSKLPSFDSIFDEESFYIFFFMLVVISCIAAYIGSKFITLEDASMAEIEGKKQR